MADPGTNLKGWKNSFQELMILCRYTSTANVHIWLLSIVIVAMKTSKQMLRC